MGIVTVPYIELNEGRLEIFSNNDTWVPMHYKQGDIDGACAVYSTAMCLLYEGIVVDLSAKGRTNGDRLLRELFDKHGLIRPGFYFKDLMAIIGKYKKKSWILEHRAVSPKRCVEGLCREIDGERTPIIGIDYSGSHEGHALLAVAYEHDEESGKIRKIFCLDPGAPAPKTAIWNSYIDVSDLRKPSTHVNDAPDFHPAKCRLTEYLIVHDMDNDDLRGYY